MDGLQFVTHPITFEKENRFTEKLFRRFRLPIGRDANGVRIICTVVYSPLFALRIFVLIVFLQIFDASGKLFGLHSIFRNVISEHRDL